MVCSFIPKLLRGIRPTIYGTGQKRRDFIFVDDVNAFHLLLIEDNRTNGQTYNVGTGTNYSIREIFDLIEAKLKTGLQPQMELDLPGEAEATMADVTDCRALGWEPRVGIDEGLERSIAYYRGQILNSVARG